ncbi:MULTISPECIES: patatin-like phospholipase family protein [unclassified Streptomyces]|uniref:patatin-like phospholipase family protein n=1 Tax=unclassified Streptomyces TaxID=2593676 RepID=UPI00225299B5|nr:MULTISPECIES: patatin-like phospholipase family protein [unclassified Streptomyces]MCX5055590.1 patatin-like phospholipase family protein [Streptomyces sp. NBC_00452]MCX5286655.1 patatin-like phospholipase family protein [Streptomyces sp. NBC_00183]
MSGNSSGTALVLGGGGPVGGAWLTGVLAGLADAGVDLGRADVVIGTSGGAIFGSRLACGQAPRELYERQLTGDDLVDLNVTTAQALRFLWAALGSRDPERSVRRLGRAALAARTAPASETYDAVRELLRGATDWPAPALRIAAVDAVTGEVAAFDADAKVGLVDAVAASCAVPLVWPPVALDGRRWIDGGSRSTANLQLARGYRRVLAVAPIPSAVGPHPSAQQQAAALTAEGAAVSLLRPDRTARRAMGRDLTATARVPAAARAGFAQATAAAAEVAEVWHS